MVLMAALLLGGCSGKKQKPETDGDRIREYANILYNRALYTQSIREYQRYIDLHDVDATQRANVLYIMGNTYFDRLNDYPNAMALYLKIKTFHPESNLIREVDKKIVACLERMNRSADAKQALDEATHLDPDRAEPSRPGTVIARIGDRDITTGDLNHQLSGLPDNLRDQFRTREAKIQFLRQMIATDLFYDAARRKGLDSDPEVIEGAFQARKSLMVQKHLEQEIAGRVTLTPDHVEDYYRANAEKYAEKDRDGRVVRQRAFQDVRQQVAEDLAREKQQRALDELVVQLMKAEGVQIYTDLVK